MRFLHIGMSTGDNGHAQGLREAFPEYKEINVGDKSLLDAAIEDAARFYKPELVFIQIQDTGISSASLQALKENGAFIINWSGDVRSRIPSFYFEYAKHVDLTCFSNQPDVDTFNRLGWPAEFLQIGYDPKTYYFDANCPKTTDIIFMGNNIGGFPLSEYRRDMVAYLKRVYGERFKAYGIGQPDGNFMSNQPGEADAYRHAKIGINLSHFNYNRYTSDRMFRMLGSGLCVLSHKFEGIHDDFGLNGSHIYMWDNLEQLTWVIDGLLKPDNNGLIDSMGDRGRQAAIDNHTFYHMGKNIEALYNKHKA